MSLATRKDIPANERLILALDVPEAGEARKVVEKLGDAVCFYKIGLELFMAGGYFELMNWLLDRGNKVFVDLKFFDVPRTVGAAVARLNDRGATFCTVHGNDAMLKAACEARGSMGILAVTALTSLDQGDLNDLGFHCDVESLVLSRARRALEIGCAGVVSSGLEVPGIRAHVGSKLVLVTPGIRPVANDDDQKRVVTPSRALQDGSDYLVIGRPILAAPDPRAAAISIQDEIARVVSNA